jgi:spore maturation protein CgeB
MKPTIAFFASSPVSAYWNSATTYRGIIRALAARGFEITFYEPDVDDRQEHRDIPNPAWARVVVYPGDPRDETGVRRALAQASAADIIVKTSDAGVFDVLLDEAVLEARSPRALVIFWDVDGPTTLDRLAANPDDPFHPLVGRYDMVLTHGGGDPAMRAYTAAGARQCVPIYNALDPSRHFPVAPDERFEADLGFLGNRLPDREARVEEFFINASARASTDRFLLGGNGWADKPRPANVRYVGHVYTNDHNAFNCTPRAILDISRDRMARHGLSPASRVFEAAGAGACVIADAWTGIEQFLDPSAEVLVARDGGEVAEHLSDLELSRARRIGAAARRRMLAAHTYDHRARVLDALFDPRVVSIKVTRQGPMRR